MLFKYVIILHTYDYLFFIKFFKNFIYILEIYLLLIKNIKPTIAVNENSQKRFQSFFQKESRNQIENKLFSLNLFSEYFLELFNKYKLDIFKHENFSEDPIFNLISKISENNDDNNHENKNDKNITDSNMENQLKDSESKITPKNIDEIFLLYLKDVYKQTNAEYFHFMFKFIILFRQCINKLKNPSTFNSPDPKNYYTQQNNAEGVPDFCNDFVTDFMEPNEYFGMDIIELIEIIQHLCFWLFEKNFTTSNLALV